MLLLLRELKEVKICAAAAFNPGILGQLRLGSHLLEEGCRMYGHCFIVIDGLVLELMLGRRYEPGLELR